MSRLDAAEKNGLKLNGDKRGRWFHNQHCRAFLLRGLEQARDMDEQELQERLQSLLTDNETLEGKAERKKSKTFPVEGIHPVLNPNFARLFNTGRSKNL